ncbi:MAG: phosphotransferase [Halofilum sp. (in: g-proteobacteria)]|nr:phosphotransferase [Halofilum sp. (in: g-proteobacteria)]
MRSCACRPRRRATACRPCDAGRLGAELDLFPEWYVRRHLGHEPDAAWWRDWSDARARLVERALAQPRVFVHRDYMPRNLMVADPLPGILDFQDAVAGPITYDLASLLRDAFLSWPVADEQRWIDRYLAGARARAPAGAARPGGVARRPRRHGGAAPPQGPGHLRAPQPPRRQARLHRRRAALPRLPGRELDGDADLAPLRAALAALPRAAPP